MAENKVLSVLIFLVLSLFVVANTAAVPAVFIFGDSTADVGTNNNLSTYAKADFPYNGIDLPGSRPTGRFSNGLNTADFIARLVGFRSSPPPFFTLIEANSRLAKGVLQGVNFASGGSGLLKGTGSQYGRVVPLSEQIKQFASVRQTIIKLRGEQTTDSLISKSLFLISVGSNDIFEMFATNTTANKHDFITTLTSMYEAQLQMLYSLGARKFGIISVPPIGCCPSQRALNPTGTGECLEDLNEYSRMFFDSVEPMLAQLSSELTRMRFSLGNAYEMVMNFMDNPLPFGFTELRTACCGNGTYNGEDPCSPSAKLCSNRDQYLFWDMYHPTQAASSLAALTLYGGSPKFVTPINFRVLAELRW